MLKRDRVLVKAVESFPLRVWIDEEFSSQYLSIIDTAWSVTLQHARAILSEFERGLEARSHNPPPSTERIRSLEWLRKVIQRQAATSVNSLGEPSLLGCAGSMMDHTAANYVAFLSGEASGEHILLREPGLTLWDQYFSSTNPLYAPHNRLAAKAILSLLKRLDDCKVLELGAGSGGGTLNVLTAIRDDTHPVQYYVTDRSPSLLIRARNRANGEYPQPRFSCLNFDRPLTRQGVAPRSMDLVVAINALHNAQDLVETLRWIRDVLKPAGKLVISESLCGADDRVHQEFIFNLLPSQAALGASRFLSIETWGAALATAGYDGCIDRNSRGQELGFLAVVSP